MYACPRFAPCSDDEVADGKPLLSLPGPQYDMLQIGDGDSPYVLVSEEKEP